MNFHHSELRPASTLFAVAAIAALAMTAPSRASVVSETEPSGTLGINDTRATSQSLDGFFSDQSSNTNIFPNDTNNFSAPIFPSVTVNGRVSSSSPIFDVNNVITTPGMDDTDFFSFNGLGGSKAFFDIDTDGLEDRLSDSRLSLFDSTGTLIGLGDDVFPNPDPGSLNNTADAFIGTYTLPSTGRYYVAVTEYGHGPTAEQTANGFGTPLARPDGIVDEEEAAGTLTGTLNDNVAVTGATPDDTFSSNSYSPPSGNYTLNVSLQNGPVGEPAPVPEPGTMSLLGVGLASLVGAARKRKKNGAEEDNEQEIAS